MNEFHMTHLAGDRRRELLAEADRERLARAAARRPVARGSAGLGGVLRAALQPLLRRRPARA